MPIRIQDYMLEMPYEGTRVDKEGIENYIKNMMRNFVPYVHQFKQTSKGYEKDGKFYSRKDIVDKFLISWS